MAKIIEITERGPELRDAEEICWVHGASLCRTAWIR